MTSIKGYTELLAAGSVGQVNDMQANFTNTIRSNVERMSALVPDATIMPRSKQTDCAWTSSRWKWPMS